MLRVGLVKGIARALSRDLEGARVVRNGIVAEMKRMVSAVIVIGLILGI